MPNGNINSDALDSLFDPNSNGFRIIRTIVSSIKFPIKMTTINSLLTTILAYHDAFSYCWMMYGFVLRIVVNCLVLGFMMHSFRDGSPRVLMRLLATALLAVVA